MSSNKIRKIVKKNNYAEGPMSMKSSLITIGGFLIICLGVYFLTDFIIDRENKKASDDTSSSEVVFDYSKILFDNLLTRPYEEYYALAVDFSKDSEYSTYSSMVDAYKEKSKSIKVYYIDLSDKLNQNYIAKTSNINTADLSLLKVSGTTLIHIKDGKIVKCYDTKTLIKGLLS